MRVETKKFMLNGAERKQVVLYASEGNVLTQTTLAEDEERIYSTQIFLANTDSPSNYFEITEQEAEALRQEDEEKRKEAENGES